MNRVSKTIFRSLLRWNRVNASGRVPFQLQSNQLGIDHLFHHGELPPIIQSNEDFQGIIYHCFKHFANTSENVDVGLNALKVLNNYNQVLRDKSLQRQVHGNPIFYQHAKFKVGQVVMNKYTKVRGVVVGWDVDAARGTQEVEWLVDTLDYQEFTVHRGSGNSRFNKMVNSENLELVEDPNLQRIHNTGLNSLFYYFDESTKRYVPKPDLSYLYPNDCEGISYGNPFAENLQVKRSMQTVTEGIQTLGKHMQVIVDEYFPDLSEGMGDDALINERIIAKQILEEIVVHIDSMIKPHPSLKSTAGLNKISFSKKLLRGGIYRKGNNISHESAASNSNLFKFNEADQIRVETAYGALFSLQEYVTSLFQILQLRFQSKGITFSDRLFVNRENQSGQFIEKKDLNPDVLSLANQSMYPIAIYEVGQVIRHKKYQYRGVISGYDHRPILDVSKWDGVQGLKLGQEQPFYRVVPDQRDTEEFLGQGSHRPYFYVAQENIELVHDPAEMVSVNHRNIGQYFLGWDHEQSRFRLPHQLKYCFPAGHHAIPENYPKILMSQIWEQSRPQGNSDEMELIRRNIIETEIKVYQKIDELLLDLFEQVKRVLSAIRDQHTPNEKDPVGSDGENFRSTSDKIDHLLFTVSDIMIMLKYAPTKEAALPVESVNWYLWTTHTDPSISSLLRLGMSHMKRGDKVNAVSCYKLATVLLPNYAEAHNKLAAIYHAQDMHTDCLESAAIALQNFPQHYGALAGQGLSYEKLGKEKEAIACIRKALDLHPFAANLPTVLQSIKVMPKDVSEKICDDSMISNVSAQDSER